MKKLLILVFLFAGSQVFAYSNIPSTGDIPTSSQWAIGMTQMACDVTLPNNAEGEIIKSNSGVTYNVYSQNGELIASASAKSTFILAKKTCLYK